MQDNKLNRPFLSDTRVVRKMHPGWRKIAGPTAYRQKLSRDRQEVLDNESEAA
jgi:hypothetical protein